ncbi:MAG TPA: SsrA-binding protein SmpB [Patescibacteria group bacterium]|jgi:SsrA-binding protein|nr:SsrA-binding protein SmpB [Patescibacteria group bacterium]
MATLANNRKAFHNYSIDDTFEAGLVLAGHEAKSAKNGQASLTGAYVTIRAGEAFLRNAHIGKYKYASGLEGYDENRDRKLLLHKQEIIRLQSKSREKGLTLIPLELYTKKNFIKLRVGLAKGKKQYDKRESIKAKESKRRVDRRLKTAV